ncbi:MAG TPA: peptidoglycan-binding protein [Bacillales bacterium]|nr:peptidoglycan-binding protein [Bacillales bacterium]
MTYKNTVRTMVTSTALAGAMFAVPAVTHAAFGDQTLKQGMKDPDVKHLQDLLKKKGYFHFSTSTGYFGEITEKAVKQFQEDHQLRVTGMVGDDMYAELGVDGAIQVTSASKVEKSDLIRIGARGAAVAELQTKLQALGVYDGAIDGIYGPITASAVRRYQRSKGLIEDGIAGPVTLTHLYGQKIAVPEKGEEKPSVPKTKKGKQAETPSFTHLLKIGSRGPAVSSLQQALKSLGYYTYGIDGIYGKRTAGAIREFQSDHGLKVDGIAGPRTYAKLSGSSDGDEPASANNEAGEKSVEDSKKATSPKADKKAAERSDMKEAVSDGLLRFHERGDSVVQLQKQLLALGLFEGQPSGYFGVDTEEAVKKFQSTHALIVDGIFGPNTKAKLLAALSALENEPSSGSDGSNGSVVDGNGETVAKSPASFNVFNMLADAADLISTPYRWGGVSPSSGFDCSGFVKYVFGQNGIDLPRTVASMWRTDYGEKVEELKPGDVLFFQNTYKSGPSHNGIYIGNGQFIQSGSSTGVTVSNLDLYYWDSHFLGAKRFF